MSGEPPLAIRNVAIFQFEALMCPARPASRGARRMWHHDWLPILSDRLGHERVLGVLRGGGGALRSSTSRCGGSNGVIGVRRPYTALLAAFLGSCRAWEYREPREPRETCLGVRPGAVLLRPALGVLSLLLWLH